MKRIAIALACLTAVVGVAAPASATVATAKKYTVKQVKKHNSPTDCWSIVDGKVYNLTAWIDRHPGGSGRIIAMCGKNASAAFNGQHGGDPRAASMLSQFQIGVVR